MIPDELALKTKWQQKATEKKKDYLAFFILQMG